MDFICKMNGEPATWPCPSPGCPLFGDCLSEREGNSKPPMTNADRIRAMSDENLAHLLCFEGWQMSEVQECLEWLQQPAEDT